MSWTYAIAHIPSEVAQYPPDTFTDNPHPSRNWKLVGDNFVSAFKNTQVLFRLVLACKIQAKKEKSLQAFGKWELPWRELRATIPSLIADSNWKVYYFLASSYRAEKVQFEADLGVSNKWNVGELHQYEPVHQMTIWIIACSLGCRVICRLCKMLSEYVTGFVRPEPHRLTLSRPLRNEKL